MIMGQVSGGVIGRVHNKRLEVLQGYGTHQKGAWANGHFVLGDFCHPQAIGGGGFNSHEKAFLRGTKGAHKRSPAEIGVELRHQA